MDRTKKSESTSESSFQKCQKKLYKEAQKQEVIQETNATRQFRTL
ncbi:15073_t:CDS:2, partial [Funneliformis mosseae]